MHTILDFITWRIKTLNLGFFLQFLIKIFTGFIEKTISILTWFLTGKIFFVFLEVLTKTGYFNTGFVFFFWNDKQKKRPRLNKIA